MSSPVPTRRGHTSCSGQSAERQLDRRSVRLVRQGTRGRPLVNKAVLPTQRARTLRDNQIFSLRAVSAQTSRVADSDRVNVATARRESEAVARSSVLHEPYVPLVSSSRSIGNCTRPPPTTRDARVLAPLDVHLTDSTHLLELECDSGSSFVERNGPRPERVGEIDRERSTHARTSLLRLRDGNGVDVIGLVRALNNNHGRDVSSSQRRLGRRAPILRESHDPLDDSVLVDDRPTDIDFANILTLQPSLYVRRACIPSQSRGSRRLVGDMEISQNSALDVAVLANAGVKRPTAQRGVHGANSVRPHPANATQPSGDGSSKSNAGTTQRLSDGNHSTRHRRHRQSRSRNISSDRRRAVHGVDGAVHQATVGRGRARAGCR